MIGANPGGELTGIGGLNMNTGSGQLLLFLHRTLKAARPGGFFIPAGRLLLFCQQPLCLIPSSKGCDLTKQGTEQLPPGFPVT